MEILPNSHIALFSRLAGAPGAGASTPTLVCKTPRGSKCPIFKDCGPKYNLGYGCLDQRP